MPIIAFTLITLGFWANPAQTVYPPSQIGVVKTVFVGKMDCSARLNDLTHVQFWCLKSGRVVHNEVNELSTVTAVTAGYSDPITQTFPDPVEAPACIRWIFAYPEFNPQTVSYQVMYSINNAPEKMLWGQF